MIDAGKGAVLGEHEFFRIIWLVALLLMVLPLALPLARGGRRWLQQAAVWVLVFGFVVAFVLVGQWLLQGG